ncbi:hypothetical protein MBLNU459_g1190t1 [Dothideomycetes sp. NU459]
MKSTISVLSFAASAAALTTSSAGTQSGCFWSVSGVGSFNTHVNYNWGTNMNQNVTDISASTYTVASNNAKFSRRFDQTNIGVSTADSAITLTVPGGQTSGPISSAQLMTVYGDILYGSVRTVAKIAAAGGTTHGFTFYSNDTQEIDFAFLTSDSSLAHFTNEQTSSTAVGTSYSSGAPSDATAAFHEYRVDWVAGKSMFYIDSVLVQTITGNVPVTPGYWVWNNWSNGNTWALGPPTSDSVLEIRSIDAYWNRTSVSTNIASGSATCAVASTSSSSTVASSTTVKPSSTSSASSTASGTSTVPSSAATLCPSYDNQIWVDPSSSNKYQINCGTDYYGGDLKMVYVSSLQACIAACATTAKCIDVSMSGQACYMKSTLTAAVSNSGVNAAKLVSQ